MSPDILCLQECLPFQADEIKMEMPRLDHFGLGRYHGLEVPKPHECYSGEHCSIFFRVARLELQRCGTFWHSETPDLPGSLSWGNELPRTTTWGVFQIRGTERHLAVFNTHYGFGADYARRTTELMLKKIPEIAGDLPTVLVGDFNLAPDSAVHRSFEDGLMDVWETLGNPEEDGGTFHKFEGSPRDRIDWIFLSPTLAPVRAEQIRYSRDGRYPSDHFPVMAEVGLTKD
jgi:endonuclease/exonuclease/phosphatase family metal-dependent hydrolase